MILLVFNRPFDFKFLSFHNIPDSFFRSIICAMVTNYIFFFNPKKPWANPSGINIERPFLSDRFIEKYLPKVFEFFLKSTATSNISLSRHLNIYLGTLFLKM